ncbi:MAG: sugar ABC transporter substrate-binding protein [Deinococcota bacterium]
MNKCLSALVLSSLLLSSAFAQVELTVAGWSSSPEEQAFLDAQLAAFTEATGIAFEFVASPDYTTTQQTAFASGDYANVFYVDSSKLSDWVEAGVVADGTGQIEAPEGIYPALLDVFTVDGATYCPPKDYATMGLQYNKDLFDAAGVAYPTNDWTWDDLRAAAEALTDAEAGIIGLITPADLPRFLPFMYQAGGDLFDDDGNYAFDSEATRVALTYYMSFAQNGIGGAPSAVDAGWGGEAFASGRAAMAMEGNWVINFMLQNAPDINWGVTELPAGPAGEGTMAFSVCYGVAADNNHPEESWQLVNFLTGEDGAAFVGETTFGSAPARPSAEEIYVSTWVPRSEGTGFDAASVQNFLNGTAYAERWVLPVGFQVFTDTFNSTLQQGFEGSVDADFIVEEVSLVAEEVLSE